MTRPESVCRRISAGYSARQQRLQIVNKNTLAYAFGKQVTLVTFPAGAMKNMPDFKIKFISFYRHLRKTEINYLK